MAAILSVWAPAEDWKVVDVHQRALERRCRQWVPFCQKRQHRLASVGWIFLVPWRWIWVLCWVQCAETLGRTRPTHIGVRARTSWSWRAQHLWKQGSKGRWWWMLWDWGSPLSSEAYCIAKVKHEQLRMQGGHPQRAPGPPDVTEFMTYQPFTWAELADMGR